MANYTIELPLGMGRTEVGRVGRGVGFNAYKVRESDSSSIAIGASLELTEETYNLANTQEHWSMEGRAIVRGKKSPSRGESREAKSGGSYRIRICDLIHVKDAL